MNKDTHIPPPPQAPPVDAPYLLALGFSIIPVQEGGKKPLVDWSEYQQRRPRAEEVSAWMEKHPAGNYGIVTGAVSGVVVLDVDDMDAAREWIEGHGGLPNTPAVRTGKGVHFYFQYPGHEVKNGTHIGPGCDFRGDGGYVVSAGSVHESGKVYEWITRPDETPFAPLPAWIEAALNREKPKPQRLTVTPVPRITDGATPYGLRALEDEIARVQAASEGTRNDTLNRAAFALGQLVAGGELNRMDVETGLHQSARACGLPPGEAAATIRSGVNDGMNEPRSAPPTNGKQPTATPPIFNFTDTGNSERFARRNRGRALYNYDGKRWMIWDGMRWIDDRTGAVQAMAKSTARGIDDEIRHVADDKREALRNWATYSERGGGRREMLNLAQSELPTNQDELDAHPWFLNLQNGTLDLNSGQLREHNPADKLTKASPVRFDRDADCPTWRNFLDRIFEGNAETIFFVQQIAGYLLTSSTQEQCFFLLHGAGMNGKSTFVNTLLHVAGDYGLQSDFSTFMVRDGKKWELADFKGARLVAASEGERGQRLAESMVKQLTGGEKMKGEHKYGKPFTFAPEFKLLLSTNHKPRIAGTDYAIWRRVCLIPFNVTISDEEKDPELLNKLKSESSGILNWMMHGLEAWKEKGLIQAESVRQATAAYRGEQDALGPFIDECCSTAPSLWADLAALYDSYKQWAEQAGEHPISKRIFTERLVERGFIKDRGAKNAVVFRTIGLRVT